MAVNFDSFKHLIDLLGGVQIDVEKKMRFGDADGNYTIRLDPGRQTLNGEKA